MIAAVHTTGVNPEAIASIAGPILVLLGAGVKVITRRLDRSRATLEERFDDLGITLKAIDSRLTDHGERIARLEGPSERRATAAKMNT